MAPIKRKKTSQDPGSSNASLGEMPDSSKPRSNGVNKGAPTKVAVGRSSSVPSAKDKASKKSFKNKDAKKQKRKGEKDGASPNAAGTKKRKKSEAPGSSRASYTGTGTDDDSSDDDDNRSVIEYPQLPEVSCFVLGFLFMFAMPSIM